MNIAPTSVSSERAFSIGGGGSFVTPRRAAMSHKTLDNLYFLKAYFDAKKVVVWSCGKSQHMSSEIQLYVTKKTFM